MKLSLLFLLFCFLHTTGWAKELGDLPKNVASFKSVSFFDLIEKAEKWDKEKVIVEGVILFGSDDPDEFVEGPAGLIRDEDPELNRINVWLMEGWYSRYREFSGKTVLVYGVFSGICPTKDRCLRSLDPVFIKIKAEPVAGGDAAR